MELQADTEWQWRPKASLTAADICGQCTIFALQYSDCAVIRVRWNVNLEAHIPDPQTDLELHGHTERVLSVKIYDKDSSVVTVCSASRDWCGLAIVAGTSCAAQTILVRNLPSEPLWVAFDETGTLVAVASEKDVKIFIIERKEVLVSLEGHLARVTRCEFHPIRHHLLVTTSEDRTFKIWDLEARKLWYQSAVLSAFSILTIALNSINGDIAFGLADGSIKVFKLLDSYAKELITFNIEYFVRKSLRRKQDVEQKERREQHQVISSLPPWARSENARRSLSKVSLSDAINGVNFNDEDVIDTNIACPVLSMKYMCSDRTDFKRSTVGKEQHFNCYHDRELVEYRQFLVVGVPGYVLGVNAYSFEIKIIHDFQHTLERKNSMRYTIEPICVAKDFCFYHPPQSGTLHCGVVSAFQPCFTMLSLIYGMCRLKSEHHVAKSDISTENPSSIFKEQRYFDDDNERVSVIPRLPPPKNSLLNISPLPAKKPTPESVKRLNKPVTFHTRIKSSGYGSTSTPVGPRRTPPKSQMASRKPLHDFGARSNSSTSVSSYLKEYPMNCGLLQHYQPKNALPLKTLHQSAILHIEYSSDAKWLATSGSDGVAQVCKLPFSRFGGDGSVFVGHNQAVRAIRWSQNDQMLVSVGSDKTSKMWFVDSDEPSLTFHGIAPPSTVATAAAAMGSMSNAKKATKQEIVDARFFYMDKFLLSACGNIARLHQFELDKLYGRASTSKVKYVKKNDIDVLLNQSRKKRVAQWSFDDMQSVTSFTCFNGAFLSSVAIFAGSDRSIRILDVGAGDGGRVVRVVRDTHSRAAHTVALPRPTCYTSHPSNFYDLLLSSAADSTTHLWDIRADNCVMRFCEHVNRIHTVGVAFSPCMRYIATGSEDRAAYIYDIRIGRRLVKLKGHSDVVTSVAFSPLCPQLATASYDGTVRFYSSVGSD